MADANYQTFPARFVSKGIMARNADDTLPEGTYLNLDNCEEQTENTFGTRMGTIIVNRTGDAVAALPVAVHSLTKLASLNGDSWRYAGVGTELYRREGTAQGPYTPIAGELSGKEWSAATYRPTLSSYPYLFLADGARMLKDNGALSTPQQWGIFAPNQPVQAVAQAPQVVVIDGYDSSPLSYDLVGYEFASTEERVNTSLTSAVTAGLATVTVDSTLNIVLFQPLKINAAGPNYEEVFVIAVDETGFTALFQQAHSIGETVTENFLTGLVAATATATVTRSSPVNLGVFPDGTATDEDDYIGFYLNVSDPLDVQQVTILFDVGDGSFTQDYFYRTIAPSVDQPAVSNTADPSQAVTQTLFASTVGIYGNAAGQASSLLTGDNVWSPIFAQLSGFSAVGNADINSTAGYSWADVVAYQVQIITNSTGSSTIGLDGLVMFGGYGPDSLGGVSYDWLYTYYNNQTGAESNPCSLMSNVNPPLVTTYITPRRQPVLLTLVPSTDPQVTNIRIYRRGGTLSANFFRLDQVPASTTTYLDVTPDASIEAADIISLTNDVPVTSTLPVPVNTTFVHAVMPAGTGQVMTVRPLSMTGISVHQQVTMGNDIDINQEIVIVISVTPTAFTAFVQNPHLVGDPITAEAVYGQPCNIIAIAFNAVWLGGDPNNPHYLYFSTNFAPESFGSPQFIEVGVPSDPIMAIIPFQGNLYVATRDHWWIIAPQTQGSPTVYPTTAVHGVYAPHGWVTTETEIWHQAVDGIRTFAGVSSNYQSQIIEFIFQGGSTPIVLADESALNQTVMTYRDNMVFVSYVGVDGDRHRIVFHTIYKRYRNDDVPANCMYTEEDTNDLIFGDVNGLIRQDRTGTVDETNFGGVLQQTPIAMNLQTSYMDQGSPKNQKQYNELTLDANTNGQPLQVNLLFNDGQIVLPIGTLQTTGRQKQNFNVNQGDGEQAYRVSMQITGGTTQAVTLYQADIRGLVLTETRQSFDSYWLKQGTDESKLCKQGYFEYTATSSLVGEVYYDSATTPGYTFTLPASARISTRVRFPAVKYRLIRVVITSAQDFQLWPDSKLEIKPICATKGYQSMNLLP